MHEVFLQRISKHKTLCSDPNFKVFLEYKDDVSLLLFSYCIQSGIDVCLIICYFNIQIISYTYFQIILFNILIKLHLLCFVCNLVTYELTHLDNLCNYDTNYIVDIPYFRKNTQSS